jgi:hypothetical protein
MKTKFYTQSLKNGQRITNLNYRFEFLKRKHITVCLCMLAAIALFPISGLFAQGSIPCDGSLYFTRQLSSSTRISSVNVNSTGTVTVSDKVTLNPAISTNATVYYNGYVFTQDWGPNTFTLARISSYGLTNNHTSKTVAGMPNNVDFNNAGVDKDGIMYILSTDATPVLYKIDLKKWDSNETWTATSANCTMTAGSRLWGDIAFDPLTNKAYVWYHPSTDPSTGQAVRGLYEIQDIATSNPKIVKVGSAANYTMGTLFFNERGQLFSYGISTATGGNQTNFFYIDKSTGAVTQIGASESSPQSDGCECAYRLSLTLTAGDNNGNVNIPNCTKPSDFTVNLAANNTASGNFSGVTFAFPLNPRFSFAESASVIETYLKGIFGSQVAVTLSNTGGGTNNQLNATGLAVPGTASNSGNPVNLPFSIKIALASGGSEFTDGEKVNFQATFGGLSDFYGTTEPSSDPLSFYGKIASSITFNKTNTLCNTLSGNVLHDKDGMTDGYVNGSNINSNLDLKAVLVNGSGKILEVTTVNTATGTYSFPIGPGTYSVILTTSNVTTSNVGGNGSEVTVTPPTNWVFTGEKLGITTGSDGTPNGILTPILVTEGDVINANFGIQQPPLATTLSYVLNSKPNSGTTIALNGTVAAASGSGSKVSAPAGSDPDASGQTPKGFIITSLPVTSGGTLVGDGPKLYYNNVAVNASDITGKTLFEDPSLFHIELNGTGYEGVSFGFRTKDAAGSESANATYTLTWNSPLPVNLVSFTSRLEEKMVRLYWKTTSEVNTSRFLLERSGNAKEWSLIKDVPALGESKTLAEYTELDKNPLSGRNYYRLKMVDKDGSFAYSRIISLNLQDKLSTLAVYPNPSSDRLFVKDVDYKSVESISLINNMGQEVLRSTSLTEKGMDVSGLASGIYSVRIRTSAGNVVVKKLVISH